MSGNNTETKSLDGTIEKAETSAKDALPLPAPSNQDTNCVVRTPDPEEGGQGQLHAQEEAVTKRDEELLRGAIDEAEQILESISAPNPQDSDVAQIISDYDYLLGDS